MFDYITPSCLVDVVVFGFLWHKASARVWYYDSGNDPVSVKNVCGLIWLVCLVVLIYQQIHFISG